MTETRFTLSRPDGQELACYIWAADKPRAIMVVAHGRGEHAGRYRSALARLVDGGITIYALDQRGHGASIELSGFGRGNFGPGGFAAVVEDLAALVSRAREDYPSFPLILLGHSMGSFVVQSFLLDHAAMLDAAVLVGTTALDTLAASMAKEADTQAALNRPFEPARTSADWLSRDDARVDAYLADALCGFPLVPASGRDLLSQGTRLADPVLLAHIQATLPLYVLVGDEDVLITSFGRLEPLIERYRAVGLSPVIARYPGGRHEMLHEINRDEVVSDLSSWIDETIENLR